MISCIARWGISAVGSAPQWHCGGQEFESLMLHHNLSENAYVFRHFSCSGIQKASKKIQRRSSRNVEAYLCVETRGLPALFSANCRFCLQSPLQEHKNARDCSFGWRCQVDCAPVVVACVGQRGFGRYLLFPSAQERLHAIIPFHSAKGMFCCFFPDLLACLVPLDVDPDCFLGEAFSMKRMVVGTDDIIHWNLL